MSHETDQIDDIVRIGEQIIRECCEIKSDLLDPRANPPIDPQIHEKINPNRKNRGACDRPYHPLFPPKDMPGFHSADAVLKKEHPAIIRPSNKLRRMFLAHIQAISPTKAAQEKKLAKIADPMMFKKAQICHFPDLLYKIREPIKKNLGILYVKTHYRRCINCEKPTPTHSYMGAAVADSPWCAICYKAQSRFGRARKFHKLRANIKCRFCLATGLRNGLDCAVCAQANIPPKVDKCLICDQAPEADQFLNGYLVCYVCLVRYSKY